MRLTLKTMFGRACITTAWMTWMSNIHLTLIKIQRKQRKPSGPQKCIRRIRIERRTFLRHHNTWLQEKHLHHMIYGCSQNWKSLWMVNTFHPMPNLKVLCATGLKVNQQLDRGIKKRIAYLGRSIERNRMFVYSHGKVKSASRCQIPFTYIAFTFIPMQLGKYESVYFLCKRNRP